LDVQDKSWTDPQAMRMPTAYSSWLNFTLNLEPMEIPAFIADIQTKVWTPSRHILLTSGSTGLPKGGKYCTIKPKLELLML
jgi:long-subunit acyl-CoA synthetase (AMP-forming)